MLFPCLHTVSVSVSVHVSVNFSFSVCHCLNVGGLVQCVNPCVSVTLSMVSLPVHCCHR